MRDDGDDTVGDRGRGPASADGKPPGSARTVHSTLVVPLRARGATLGVAQFCRDRNPDAFDDEDLLLAQEIAARGGGRRGQRPPLHACPRHRPHPATQPAPAPNPAPVRRRRGLPLPAGRCPRRGGRRLVRRHPALRGQGRPRRG
ncbi:GAF domain-containing protein [Streptomyces stelliscabiei]|uniref:GAF domain-containing protein n=1 Tax=Streptomyces stelliscabiei TaxID=146820 RepID=UPI003A8D8090